MLVFKSSHVLEDQRSIRIVRLVLDLDDAHEQTSGNNFSVSHDHDFHSECWGGRLLVRVLRARHELDLAFADETPSASTGQRDLAGCLALVKS